MAAGSPWQIDCIAIRIVACRKASISQQIARITSAAKDHSSSVFGAIDDILSGTHLPGRLEWPLQLTARPDFILCTSLL